MKGKLVNLIIFFLLWSLPITTVGQKQETQFVPDTLVRDTSGNPLYVINQIIVKFHPDVVNKTVVDDKDKQTGTVSEFVDSVILDRLIDSGYFDAEIAGMAIRKIHRNLTTSETHSTTRNGEIIAMPEFWSTFLIYYDTIGGLSF